MVRVKAAVPERKVENKTKNVNGMKNHLAHSPKMLVNITKSVWIISPLGGGKGPENLKSMPPTKRTEWYQ